MAATQISPGEDKSKVVSFIHSMRSVNSLMIIHSISITSGITSRKSYRVYSHNFKSASLTLTKAIPETSITAPSNTRAN